MFGWRLISDKELALQAKLVESQLDALKSELAASKEYARKCEALIDHERQRIDQERERADRMADSLFQSNGLPATSATVIREQQALEADAKEKRNTYLDELNEIYGESMEELIGDGAEALPEGIAAQVSVQ